MAEVAQDELPLRSIDSGRIVSLLEANVIEADVIQGAEVSEQRQRNHIYYSLDRMGNERAGRSQYVSADVHDVVEGSKALYRESTQSSSRFFEFEPEGPDDDSSAEATAYVNDVFYGRSVRGDRLIRDALHDAFVAKRAVARVDFVESSETIEQPFQNVTEQQLVMMLQRPEVLGLAGQPEMQELPGPRGPVALYSGSAIVENDLSDFLIELVQSERYYRDPNVAYVEQAAFAGYQEDLPRYELIDRGFDRDEVMALRLDYRFRQNEEDAARKAHDATWSRARRHKRAPEQEIVTVYWHWCYLDLSEHMTTEDPELVGVRLYRFCFSSGKLLTLPETGEMFEAVEDGMPFLEWTQYKISHAEFGLCDSDLAAQTQYTKSNILRLAVDNIAMSNTSRWKARHGFIKNPRELLDNNIGSVVWTKAMDAIEPMPTPPLSPNTLSVYEQINRDKEQRTGQSALSKGLNTDAIRYQNADDMVERLTNASNRRTMMGVRDFCTEFLAEIALRIYNLGRKYDQRPRTVEVAGEYRELLPTQFRPRTKVRVRTALTPDARQTEAQFLLLAHESLRNDPELSILYGLEQRHALMDEVFELMGRTDTSRFMMQPDDPRVQQALMQRSQMAQRQQQMQEMGIAAELQAREREEARKDRESDAKLLDMASDNSRADDKLEADNFFRGADLALKRAEVGIEAEQNRPVKIGS
jgi:hypothetical protein